jgi:hypothetical protein
MTTSFLVEHIEIGSRHCYTIYKFLNAGCPTRRLGNKIKFIAIQKENAMKLSAPKQITWIIAVVLGVLGLLGSITTIAGVSANAFWFVFIGFALLAVATLVDGL